MADRDIGTLIRKRRQALGLRQHELAARVGVDRSAVSNWERGHHFPLRYQGRIEEVLGISLDEEPGLPDLVAAHASDERVMEIWRLETIPPDTRLAMISVMLGREAIPRRRESR